MDIFVLEGLKKEMEDCLENTMEMYKQILNDADAEKLQVNSDELEAFNKFENLIESTRLKFEDYKYNMKNADPSYLICNQSSQNLVTRLLLIIQNSRSN